MKKPLALLGMLYVIVSALMITDLNPLLCWSWYRESLNSLFNGMMGIHKSLPLLWIMSIFPVAAAVKAAIEIERRKTLH